MEEKFPSLSLLALTQEEEDRRMKQKLAERLEDEWRAKEQKRRLIFLQKVDIMPSSLEENEFC